MSRKPDPTLLSLALAALIATGLPGCSPDHSDTGKTAPVATTDAKAGAPALGSFGFDAAGMDRNVAPGDDFFEYANGTWVATTQIPPDRSSFNSFTRILIDTEQNVRRIIEDAAADTSSQGETRKIGDTYTAFMDEAGIEAKGIAPIQPQLDAIASITDQRALATELGGQLRADVDLLNATDYYTDRLFGLWVSQDLHQPTRNVPYLVQGGLGMPDRSFYLDGGRMAELRAAYQAHVAKVLELAGIDDAAARAERIVVLETAIARVHATQEQTNDVEAGANSWAQPDFATKAPGLDWTAFLQAAGLAGQQDFIVWQPDAVAGISALVASQPLATWKDYLAFHALDRAAAYLPRAFADEQFAFYGKTLNGTPEQRERWKRAVAATNDALGEAVGQQYVARHVNAETRARAEAMVANLIAAFGKRIDALEWMSPQTKAEARAKVAGLHVALGYPDRWRDYSALEVKPDDALGNARRAEVFEYRRNLAKLGQPVNHDEWYLLPQTVNALNVPLENRLIFPAAILQPPFFDPAADDAVNYGAIGAVIGHEISHSFDNLGALFDKDGKLHNWWTPQDLQRFEAAGDALAAQFSQYKAFDDLPVNGKLTLGENIADVAGLATAYDAYHLSLQDKPPATLEGFSPDQRFFLGFAQAWRGKYREPALRNAILTDVHAPGRFRTQTVRNLDAWYSAFDVKQGQQLYLAPQDRVEIW
ncbi:peptidase M13 [Lysobacter concretionis Ko07 = DSM 16239]|uniref:Peptidase M13 n=1 Tax=Lysobacter concretionis Ko07 = DSM 16239 TaxID=1122185 RepID=A0A0A0ELF7_9GAMM|nr:MULTISPECIES: M13 family metallopeptidase [Lysobacter]KGM51135.1 peptidase M13 [Lysobacter concretionis Ko07 = DSM 16239]QOD90879.1 M13 family metallopeptidase [Lysobacter sp. CW239]